jgi:hypothetical protein
MVAHERQMAMIAQIAEPDRPTAGHCKKEWYPHFDVIEYQYWLWTCSEVKIHFSNAKLYY